MKNRIMLMVCDHSTGLTVKHIEAGKAKRSQSVFACIYITFIIKF